MVEIIFLLALVLSGLVSDKDLFPVSADGCLTWALPCLQGETSGISYYEDTNPVGLGPWAGF